MSRLTEKKFLDNFKAIKNISPNYVASKEELMYEKLGKYEDLEEELGLSIDDIKSCVIALKGLINTFDITCDSKVRMNDRLDGIADFPYYKNIVYHKEITKAIELLKEDYLKDKSE